MQSIQIVYYIRKMDKFYMEKYTKRRIKKMMTIFAGCNIINFRKKKNPYLVLFTALKNILL